MIKKVIIRGKQIEIPLVICRNKALGLMFSSKEDASNLLFEFNKPRRWAIHSFFVFYPFIAIWIHEKKVIAWKKVNPFTFSVKPKIPFTQLIEIPINEANKKLVKSIVGK